MWQRFSVFGKVALGVMMGFALSVALSGCGASMAEKVAIKESVVIPQKHKKHRHHRHYHRF